MRILGKQVTGEVCLVSQGSVSNCGWVDNNTDNWCLCIVVIIRREEFADLQSNMSRIIVLHAFVIAKLAICDQLILTSNYIDRESIIITRECFLNCSPNIIAFEVTVVDN